LSEKRIGKEEMKKRFEEIFSAIPIATKGRAAIVLGSGEMPEISVIDEDNAISAIFTGAVKASTTRKTRMRFERAVALVKNGEPQLLLKESNKSEKFRVANKLNGVELQKGTTLEETIENLKSYIETNIEGKQVLKPVEDVLKTGIN
jgi:hypothetical protein